MRDDFPERFIDGSEEKSFGNELDEGLTQAFRSGVGNCEYSQKTILSAIIEPYLEVVDEEELIFKIDTEELNLEKWSDRYS
ncbi:hypothetical protein [Salarchaeum japonicum]|uniref:Uncharacterized protein n=1 Tax=Salarchaeum japonicum TaxID=555573 RepID=A0AAV3SYC9_9EURY|nr:hypothetical protein [Salarchaeum japonicum]